MLENLAYGELSNLKTQLEAQVFKRKAEHKRKALECKVTDFVTLPVDFITDYAENLELMAEIEKLDLKSKGHRASVVTQWITDTGQDYVWNTSAGNPVIKTPIGFEKFPTIQKLLDRLNQCDSLKLNSVLVSCLPDGRSNLRLHNDAEDTMDSTQPIVVLSVGATRAVDFMGAYQKSGDRPLLTVTPLSGTVYSMLPGCQDYFKHRILADKSVRGIRYSLSFRCMKVNSPPCTLSIPPAPGTPSASAVVSPSSAVKDMVARIEGGLSPPSRSVPLPPVTDDIASVGQPARPGVKPHVTDSSGQPARPEVKPRVTVSSGKKNTTVLFGTSITADVVGKRLGLKGRNVINISESGADIKIISNMIDDFFKFDSSADDVDKVVLCFGTNDIMHEKRGVRHLISPVFRLINKVKTNFPGATVLVMCTLPMKNMYWYTVQNVLDFNDILRDVSYKTNAYFVDCFDKFLSYDGSEYNSRLFKDAVHPNNRGMGVLCSVLKTIINTDSFSSVIRTHGNTKLMDYYNISSRFFQFSEDYYNYSNRY